MKQIDFLFLWILFCAYVECHFHLNIQMRRRILGLVGDEASAATILGANFSAGFVAGTVAAAATCPLDVAKTRRQIEVVSQSQACTVLITMFTNTNTTPPRNKKCRNLNIGSSEKDEWHRFGKR